MPKIGKRNTAATNALKTESVLIDSVTQDPSNAMGHPERNIETIKGSLKRFGQQKPIVVSSDGIIRAGNGTWQAAKALGWGTIEIVRTDLKGVEATAYSIADNRTAELSEWDSETLVGLLEGFDDNMLEAAGFSNEELQTLISETGVGGEQELEDSEPEIDRAEELKDEWGVESGQLWLVGNHRLLCGDSTKEKDIKKVLDGSVPFIMVTDPPYGVELDQSWRDEALGDKAVRPGNKNKVSNDDRSDWTDTWRLFPGDVMYVWHAGTFSDVVMNSIRLAKFEVCQQLIWNKSIFVMGRNDYHFKHEPCWYAVRKGKNHGWVGDRKQTTVIDASSPKHIMSGSNEEKTIHPTQKPIECMAYMIRNHKGEVYDPFLGSGTTMVACENLGRTCYGIEIDPGYVAVTLQRMIDTFPKLDIRKGE